MTDIKKIIIRARVRHNLPSKIGAYVITYISQDKTHALKYIGSTEDLRHRLYNHTDKNILYVDIYMTNTLDFAKRLEGVLINILSPICYVTNLHIPLLDKGMLEELEENDTYNKLVKTGKEDVKIGYRYLVSTRRPNELPASIMNKINNAEAWYRFNCL